MFCNAFHQYIITDFPEQSMRQDLLHGCHWTSSSGSVMTSYSQYSLLLQERAQQGRPVVVATPHLRNKGMVPAPPSPGTAAPMWCSAPQPPGTPHLTGAAQKQHQTTVLTHRIKLTNSKVVRLFVWVFKENKHTILNSSIYLIGFHFLVLNYKSTLDIFLRDTLNENKLAGLL